MGTRPAVKKVHLIYEFGGFRLDTEQRVLGKNGDLVPLPPKVLDTLIFLVQNRGRVLEKRELVEALWPQSFVEESNLSQNIFLLRKTLGDDRGPASFIQTIPRRGYRFVAEVKESEATAAEAHPNTAYWENHSPFRSLQTFEPEDSWLFFGRETEVADLRARLQDSPVLGVVGNSGCGKSSLVRAGLIPALQPGTCVYQGRAIRSWRTAICRPAAAPFDYLAEVLPRQIAPDLSLTQQSEFIADSRSRLAQGGDSLRNVLSALAGAAGIESEQEHVLLVIDQFEELFTLTSDPGVRNRYIDALLAAARIDSAIAVHLVLVLRADFFADCLNHPGLSRCLQANLYNVPRMTPLQLATSIEKRLSLAASPAESGLMNALLEDVGVEPGNLALLEHAVGQLWEKCGGAGRTLTNTAYAEIGRLRGALGRHADSVYASMRDDGQRALMRKIFLELVHLGEGTQDTRRRIPKSELYSFAAAEMIELMLTRLVSSRLISTNMERGMTFVEVSHEALIREWPALREWLQENRDDLRFGRRLHEIAEDWESLGNDSGALLHGARLAQAQEWLAKHPSAPQLLQRFVTESVAFRAEEKERELARQRELRMEAEARANVERKLREQQADRASEARRAASRLRWLSVAMALLAVVAVAAALSAYRQQLVERSHALAARSAELLSRDRGQALELALRAWETARSDETRLALVRAFPEAIATLQHDGAVMRVVVSPDGRYILSVGKDHSVRLWTRSDGRLVATLQGHTAEVDDAVFSRDGQQILTASQDHTARLWSLDGKLKAVLAATGVADVYNRPVNPRAAFSPDGTKAVSAGWDKFARIWDTSNGRLLFQLQGHTDNVTDAEFSPDGNYIVTASLDHTACIWRASDGRLLSTLKGHTEWLEHAEFFPDGDRVITTSWDRTARIWRRSDGTQLAMVSHDGPVTNARFAPDGQRFMTLSRDGNAKLWSAGDYHLLFALHHDGSVHSAEFSRDGRYMVTASNDRTARLWNASGKLLLIFDGHSDAIETAAFCPDNRCVVTGSLDHTAKIWSTTTAVLSGTLRGHTDYLRQIDFSPDSDFILTVSHDHTARIWNFSGKNVSTLRGGPIEFRQGRFSPDGTRIVTASAQGVAQVWRAADGQLLSSFQEGSGGLWHAEFSPDGQRILSCGDDGTGRIWNASTGRVLVRLQGHAKVIWYAAFSPDGKRVVTASDDHTARIWDASDGRLLSVLSGHEDSVWRASFSPDNKYVVTGSFDKTARVWRADNGQLIAVLRGHNDKVIDATFSPDSSKVVTASWDHSAAVWSSTDGRRLGVLAAHSARVIDAQFSPDGRYVTTCGDDHMARLWTSAGYELLATLDGHAEPVWQAVFSPDGRHVVTASVDQTARIWHLQSLEDLAAILAD